MEPSPLPHINLFRGWPSPDLLPVSILRHAADHALSNSEISIPALLYGEDPGYEPLRVAIARWLGDFFLTPWTSPERICITGGASQNMACILQMFTDPYYTSNIFMTSPTYFLACSIFEDNGFYHRLRSVPEDSQGINIAYLEKSLRESAKSEPDAQSKYKGPRAYRKVYRHVIYAVPTFSNPSGQIMSLQRRRQLVRLAREYDALIITDDVYDCLFWPRDESKQTECDSNKAILPRLVDVDHELDGGVDREGADGFGNAVSNGSFSKILGPGCRTGWAEASKKFIYALSQVGSTCSGGAPSQLVAAIIVEPLRNGDVEKHIRETLQPALAERWRSMNEALKEFLQPLGVVVRRPTTQASVAGGYFVWIDLPTRFLARELSARALAQQNVAVAAGNNFRVFGDSEGVELNNSVRLCFAWESSQMIKEGIRRLAVAMEDMENSTNESAFMDVDSSLVK